MAGILRSKTTPASTPGSFAPHSRSDSEVTFPSEVNPFAVPVREQYRTALNELVTSAPADARMAVFYRNADDPDAVCFSHYADQVGEPLDEYADQGWERAADFGGIGLIESVNLGFTISGSSDQVEMAVNIPAPAYRS